jgi:hypothetical protein
MHSLGVIAVVVGGLTALSAEGVLLGGALTGHWHLSEFQRRSTFHHWFFGGLALVLIGAVLAAIS